MTIAATQTTRVYLDVPGARTLNEAAARLTDPGSAGGDFLVIRTEVGGIHFAEVDMAAAVGSPDQAGPSTSQAPPSRLNYGRPTR